MKSTLWKTTWCFNKMFSPELNPLRDNLALKQSTQNKGRKLSCCARNRQPIASYIRWWYVKYYVLGYTLNSVVSKGPSLFENTLCNYVFIYVIMLHVCGIPGWKALVSHFECVKKKKEKKKGEEKRKSKWYQQPVMLFASVSHSQLNPWVTPGVGWECSVCSSFPTAVHGVR